MTDILNIHSPEWMAEAKCAGRPTSNHPADLRAYGIEVDVRWQPDGATQEDRAVRNCAGCPVLTKCLSFAMADPDLTGVWGGTTTAQRVAYRRGKVA